VAKDDILTAEPQIVGRKIALNKMRRIACIDLSAQAADLSTPGVFGRDRAIG
jgi:hypothetical protein